MTRRNEAPPRGQKHDTRLVRFRKFLSLHLKPPTPTTATPSPSTSPAPRLGQLHPRQVRALKELDRLKGEGKLQPGFRLQRLAPPNPAPNAAPSPVPKPPPVPSPQSPLVAGQKFPPPLPSLPKVPEGGTSTSSESNTALLLSMFPPEA